MIPGSAMDERDIEAGCAESRFRFTLLVKRG